MTTPITSKIVPENLRLQHTGTLFGDHFPLYLEPAVFNVARNIAPEYQGGYWDFYTLSNAGFYMAPYSEELFSISSDNGFRGQLTAEGLGITACLYAFSHLSFSNIDGFAESCAEHYHLLRAYMLDHPEASVILGAID